MQDSLKKLKELLYEVYDINNAIAVLGWDQQTYMPRGGAEDRANALGTLSSIAHIKFTSPEIGRLLDKLNKNLASLDSDSDDACLIKFVQREYRKRTQVPAKLVSEIAETCAMAEHVWEEAREKSDFSSFAPWLEKVFNLKRSYAEIFTKSGDLYDALLDDYEPGMKSAVIAETFAKLKPKQLKLIKTITSSKQVDDSFLYQKYDEQKQWDFGVEILNAMGYDWHRGRQDKTAHPFTTTFGLGDIRITTRIIPKNAVSALFSSMHEGGHALYEQGIALNLRRLPLATGVSLGIHESQSRLWENLLGRSKNFWKFAYPLLKKKFPKQLEGISLEKFYRGINKVEPSLIRVESDEATYNLHIMLRFELETEILNGKIKVSDLPEIWNSRMHEYLGVTPQDNAHGVLQDVHWGAGLIGYFPTYALGNLFSAQLWELAEKEIPQLDEEISRGQLLPLREWLREKIHRHGAKFEPAELIKRSTGGGLDPAPYIKYLTEKYSAIYGF